MSRATLRVDPAPAYITPDHANDVEAEETASVEETGDASEAGDDESADDIESTTADPEPDLVLSEDAQTQYNFENQVPFRIAAINAQLDAQNGVTPTAVAADPEGFTGHPDGAGPAFEAPDYIEMSSDPSVDPEIPPEVELYVEWSDPEVLEQHLEENGDLNEYSDGQMAALAALSVDVPATQDLIRDAVSDTVLEAETLDDLPDSDPFDFLVGFHLTGPQDDEDIESETRPAVNHLRDMVEDELQASFDRSMEGARGDEGLEQGFEAFRNEIGDLAVDHAWLGADRINIDRRFETVIEQNLPRIHDIRRADDRWYQRANHWLTEGTRGLARSVADEFFLSPEAAANYPGYMPFVGHGRAAEIINSDTGIGVQQFVLGVSRGAHGAITGPAEFVTDPVGTTVDAYNGFQAFAQDPTLLRDAFYDAANSPLGLPGALGTVGFDLMLAALPAGQVSGAVRNGRRFGRFVPDGPDGPGGHRLNPAPDATAGPLHTPNGPYAGNLLLQAQIRAGRLPDVDTPDGVRMAQGLGFNADSDAWRALDVDVRQAALDRAAALTAQGAPDTLVLPDAVNHSAFHLLGTDDQQRLIRHLGSDSRQIGAPVRAYFRDEFLNQRQLSAASPVDQRRMLEEFIDQPHRQDWFVTPEAGHYRPNTSFQITGSQALGPNPANPALDFTSVPAGTNAPAGIVHTLEIDGRTVEVLTPNGSSANSITARQVGDMLAAMPAEARNRVNAVVIEPNNPISGSAWADAGVDGTIRMYADSSNLPPDGITDVFAHEVGHLVSFDEMGGYVSTHVPNPGPGQNAWQFSYPDSRWDRWRAAVAADEIGASQYATRDVGEDFAETFRLYMGSRGTPEHAALRELMPERFAIIDDFVNHNAPPPGLGGPTS